VQGEIIRVQYLTCLSGEAQRERSLGSASINSAFTNGVSINSASTNTTSTPFAQLSRSFGSTTYPTVRSDALKDEDNAAWVCQLPLAVQQIWIDRIRAIRLVDRLAEREWVNASPPDERLADDRCVLTSARQFSAFYQAWHHTLQIGTPPTPGRDRWEVCQVYEALFGSQMAIDPILLNHWNCYLTAIITYHQPHLQVETLADYEQMLLGLGGQFFQVLPFLQPHQLPGAQALGILDQCYNHLRDLAEDFAQGICYFPQDLLNHFHVDRAELLAGQAVQQPGYQRLIEYLLSEFLTPWRQQAQQFAQCQDLHPSWQVLCDWSLARYERLERVMRSHHFDYHRFTPDYWSEVRHLLQQYHAKVRAKSVDNSVGKRASQ